MAVTAKTPPKMSAVQTVNQGTIAAAAVPSVGVPTKAEFDAVVALVNDLRQVALNQGIVS